MFSTRRFRVFAVSLLMAGIILSGAGMATGQEGGGVWKDDATGLTWAVKDNGMPITPAEGRSYCDALKTGGIDWRLPTIDEVEGIYDSKEKKQYKAKGTIELSEACVLTSSTNRGGDVFTFCFNSGSRNIGGGSGCGTTAIALCVNGASSAAVEYRMLLRSRLVD